MVCKEIISRNDEYSEINFTHWGIPIETEKMITLYIMPGNDLSRAVLARPSQVKIYTGSLSVAAFSG
jgi:hypothetical protein